MLGPNITGEFKSGGFNDSDAGAFEVKEHSGDGLGTSYSGLFKTYKVHNFSAKRDNPIYSVSTFQPKAVRGLSVIKS